MTLHIEHFIERHIFFKHGICVYLEIMNTYNEYDSMYLSNDRCTHVEYFIAPQAFMGV